MKQAVHFKDSTHHKRSQDQGDSYNSTGGKFTFVGLLKSLLRAPFAFKSKNLDDRFKYQYSYDRFRVDASPGGKSYKDQRIFKKNARSKEGASNQISEKEKREFLREELFSDKRILTLSSSKKFNCSEAMLFLRLSDGFNIEDLKIAYRTYVRANHPDFLSGNETSEGNLYALAQRKIQLANEFRELLSDSINAA